MKTSARCGQDVNECRNLHTLIVPINFACELKCVFRSNNEEKEVPGLNGFNDAMANNWMQKNRSRESFQEYRNATVAEAAAAVKTTPEMVLLPSIITDCVPPKLNLNANRLPRSRWKCMFASRFYLFRSNVLYARHRVLKSQNNYRRALDTMWTEQEHPILYCAKNNAIQQVFQIRAFCNCNCVRVHTERCASSVRLSVVLLSVVGFEHWW